MFFAPKHQKAISSVRSC